MALGLSEKLRIIRQAREGLYIVNVKSPDTTIPNIVGWSKTTVRNVLKEYGIEARPYDRDNRHIDSIIKQIENEIPYEDDVQKEKPGNLDTPRNSTTISPATRKNSKGNPYTQRGHTRRIKFNYQVTSIVTSFFQWLKSLFRIGKNKQVKVTKKLFVETTVMKSLEDEYMTMWYDLLERHNEMGKFIKKYEHLITVLLEHEKKEGN